MRNRPSDCTSRREEEEVDVRIYLANNAEVDVEMKIQAFQWDVRLQGAIFPLVAEAVRFQLTVTILPHQNNRV